MKVGLVMAACYIIGAVPIGLIVGKLKGVDIRRVGSGNIGATNVLRALGRGPALVVFTGDTAKGVIAVMLTREALKGDVPPHALQYYVIAGALASIIGHSFSVFLGFRGGKAVATSLGVIIGLNPLVALVAFAFWVILVACFRYVSVASILASASVPALMHFSKGLFGKEVPMSYQFCALAAALFILVRHRSNLQRLFSGTEPRIGERLR